MQDGFPNCDITMVCFKGLYIFPYLSLASCRSGYFYFEVFFPFQRFLLKSPSVNQQFPFIFSPRLLDGNKFLRKMFKFASDQIVGLTSDWEGFKIELNYQENGKVSDRSGSSILKGTTLKLD